MNVNLLILLVAVGVWLKTRLGVIKGRLVRGLWNRSRINPCFVVNGPIIANLVVEIFYGV